MSNFHDLEIGEFKVTWVKVGQIIIAWTALHYYCQKSSQLAWLSHSTYNTWKAVPTHLFWATWHTYIVKTFNITLIEFWRTTNTCKFSSMTVVNSRFSRRFRQSRHCNAAIWPVVRNILAGIQDFVQIHSINHFIFTLCFLSQDTASACSSSTFLL